MANYNLEKSLGYNYLLMNEKRLCNKQDMFQYKSRDFQSKSQLNSSSSKKNNFDKKNSTSKNEDLHSLGNSFGSM